MANDITLVIDAGTTSVRAIAYDDHLVPLGVGQHEFAQHFPQSGWVEHDQDDIWEATLASVRDALVKAQLEPTAIARIGITNQRETTCLWDRATGEPIARAIVWQDRRTAPACDALRESGVAETIHAATGLVVDAYFSATKIAWLLDNTPGARDRAERGELAFGTVDTMLLWRMTGGATHATEPSNACRTMLYGLDSGTWDDSLCDALNVPRELLGDIKPSFGDFGVTDPAVFLGIEAPVTGILGDQQAALFGHDAHNAGDSKVTWGTGSFLLFTTGHEPVRTDSGLLTSVGWQEGTKRTYVLEGSVFVTGAALQWLRDGLGLLDDAADSAKIAADIALGCDGVTLVPAFTGLGAPHWDPDARGLLYGLSRGTSAAHIVRAALEAIAHQCADLTTAMAAAAGTRLQTLRVDGGAAENELLCQLQADIAGVEVIRPANTEMTALGAAKAAWHGHTHTAVGGQVPWQNAAAGRTSYTSAVGDASRDALRLQWADAVSRTLTRD